MRGVWHWRGQYERGELTKEEYEAAMKEYNRRAAEIRKDHVTHFACDKGMKENKPDDVVCCRCEEHECEEQKKKPIGRVVSGNLG